MWMKKNLYYRRTACIVESLSSQMLREMENGKCRSELNSKFVPKSRLRRSNISTKERPSSGTNTGLVHSDLNGLVEEWSNAGL